MLENNNFKLLSAKFKKESILKSILLASIFGSVFISILFILSLFLNWNLKLYVFILLFLFISTVLSFLFYIYKFKLSDKEVSKRIDNDERVLTSFEFQNDDSFFIKKQREDANNYLSKLNPKNIKILISIPLIIISIFSLLFTSASLTAYAVNPNIGNDIHSALTPKTYYKLDYYAEGEGYIIDYSRTENEVLLNEISKVAEEIKPIPYTYTRKMNISYKNKIDDVGATIIIDNVNFENIHFEKSFENGTKSGIKVMALPNKGYCFIGWSDGVKSPYREDFSDVSVCAVFDKVENINRDDDSDKKPGDSDAGNQSSSGGGNGNGGTSGGGNGDGAKTSPANKVIDGNIYYGDIFNASFTEAIERVKNSTELTDSEKQKIIEYFESIRKG